MTEPTPPALDREAEYALGAADAYRIAAPRLTEVVSTLENYGDHHEWCPDRAHCTCGYVDALGKARGNARLTEASAALALTPTGDETR